MYWGNRFTARRTEFMSAVNEALIRDVVGEVLGRLGGAPGAAGAAPASARVQAPKPDCGCNGNGHSAAPAARGRFGVFQDAGEACVAAQESFLQLQKAGV